ncbi:serine/threonine-protein kinase [Actinomycetospora termitidis]|uniref:non-specific serine/threonine protein kinase n=1 Tax=Actinomycetospora termitidis TaxID=3053470 RepID=A0ABT7MAT7_9PSEU|nr:serine/threonine-protein kinase [Actinomycetospora sp. Odt1-22]MDL5157556.1 serine/threonine-protein kinase [Actinomycetospora sp. Odt1-22]
MTGTSTTSEDLTGSSFGRFRIEGLIGRGGMSTVYRATDTRLGRVVALKVIDAALARDEEFRERFRDEARNTSAVDHPHVVPLYDVDSADDPHGATRLYIAMRFVEGPDLAALVGGRPLAPERTLRLLDQVADALDAVHDHGLVHLDVKPANVLVGGATTGGDHAYLADFGLTHRGATGHRTRGGDFLGSPTFAAPEHLRGEPVDARTDLYSLGCVLYACLAGHAPYRGTVTEVIDAHLAGDVPSVGHGVALGPGIDDLLRRAMSVDPDRRPGSARGLVGEARTALARRPLPTTGRVARAAPPAVPPRGGNPHAVRTPGSSPHPAPGRPRPPARGPVVGNGMPARAPLPPRTTPPPRRIQAPAPPTDLGAFGGGRSGGRPFLVPVIAGAVLVVLVVVLLVALL